MAIVHNPQTLNLDDIQGMITRGYAKLMNTAYIHLQVKNAENTRAWIKSILPDIASASVYSNSEQTLHLAITYSGLLALGMEEENARQFPNPFREGMATPHRSSILGDYDANDPSRWRWGGNDDTLHLLLILHSKSSETMKVFLKEQKEGIEKVDGLVLLSAVTGYQRADYKEPFGFHDGISQPTIEGSGRPGPENDIVATGEFLMGYKNAYKQYPYTPLLEKTQGNIALLSDDAAGSGKKDLGRNGTFMVYRQIEQHVDQFWKCMEAKTVNKDGTPNEKEKVKLAARAIGRWPSGASLVNFPDEDPGGAPANDDFGYADIDPDGARCPYSSHLRRNNPRDNFRWYGKKDSLKVSHRHRIIRRGRIYEGIPGGGDSDKEIGLHFICFNANIQLQFEFIQHAWANNNQLHNLSNDIDLVIGVPAKHTPEQLLQGQFTIQSKPANQFVKDWERFVTIRGGQYFFMPSISVINYLTTL